MVEKNLRKNNGTPINQLGEDHQRQVALFDRQPPIVQRFLETQAKGIALAYVERAVSLHFKLPDRVISPNSSDPLVVEPSVREQHVGTFNDRIRRHDVHETLRIRLAQLDQYSDEATRISAGLIRYSTAVHMVYNMLPSGKKVQYLAEYDDDIPSIPNSNESSLDSAITATTDAITEEVPSEDGRGTLQVPFVPTARRFFLPQWIGFDMQDRMIVNSPKEAESHISSMQRFLTILFAARSLAPYMVADEEFENKRYGMLGQLVNQGRALARFQTRDIIQAIWERARGQSLNRGLSLSLPYFDDQDLKIESYEFVIIPAGRIMFIPAFVVRATIEEQAKITQDTRFSNSTRRHLLNELQMLRDAFESPEKSDLC